MLYFENMKIGKSTLIKCKGKDKNGRAVWIILCGCGNNFLMNDNSLHYARKRNRLSCGCDYVMGHTVNLKKNSKKYAEFLQNKKLKLENKKNKEKTFFCKFREKLNEDFFQNPKRAKCYSREFCREKKCITFSYIIQKYTNYRGVNNAIN